MLREKGQSTTSYLRTCVIAIDRLTSGSRGDGGWDDGRVGVGDCCRRAGEERDGDEGLCKHLVESRWREVGEWMMGLKNEGRDSEIN